jgi:hypothetical protein
MRYQEKVFEQYYYEIKVKGHLDMGWSTWLNCVAVTFEVDEYDQIPVTVLTSPISDQPALRGLLNKLFDLNLTILSVNRCNPDTDINKP